MAASAAWAGGKLLLEPRQRQEMAGTYVPGGEAAAWAGGRRRRGALRQRGGQRRACGGPRRFPHHRPVPGGCPGGGTAPGAMGMLRGHPRRGCSGCRLGMGASPCRGPHWCWLSSERANSVHGRGAGEAGLLPCWACASAAGRQPAIEPRRGRHRAAVLQGPGDGDTRGVPPPVPSQLRGSGDVASQR